MVGERSVLLAFLLIHLHVFVSSLSIKQGFCPYLPPPTYCLDNNDLCNTDEDCPISNFKCCPNQCKKICAGSVSERSTAPLSAPSERSRPGNCPLLPVQKYCISEIKGCSNDFDCKDQFKCCSNGCVKSCFLATTRKAIKSGNAQQRNASCPLFPTSNTNCPSSSTNQCQDDTNCLDQGSAFKCCWDGCRKICLNPSEVQQNGGRGLCPDLRRETRCTHVRHECISDSECRDDKICCSDGCTMICLRSKAVAANTSSIIADRTAHAVHKKFRLDDKCPFIPRPSRCSVGILHQCYSNEECPQSLRCCSDGCRNICFDITKDISVLMCPIVRRPKRCPEYSSNVCSSSNDCERRHRCCYDGCQYRCFGRDGFVQLGSHSPPPTTVRPTTTAEPATEARSTIKTQPETPTPTPGPQKMTTHFNTPDATTTTLPSTQPTTTTQPKHQEQPITHNKYVAPANTRHTQTILIKPGRCPPITRRTECRNLQRRCFTDADCNADGKCCSDGCAQSCVKPVSNVEYAPPRGKPKAGICPMVSRLGIPCPLTDQCKTDSECAGKKKCCTHFCQLLVCVDPPSAEEERRLMRQLYRSGKCPILAKPDVCQPNTNVECNYDVDCSPPKKCCSDGCNRRCVDIIDTPIPTIDGNVVGGDRVTITPNSGTIPGVIVGRCPPYSPVRKCPPLVQDTCTCTSDCTSDLKCCFDGCKRICRKPAGKECSARVDIVYLMDTSGSISIDDYRLEKQFVKDLARIFRIGVDASHAAAVIYNDDPQVMIKLGDHSSTDDFAKAVDEIPYLRGRTRIDKALRASTEVFQNARKTVRKVLVVLTDGRQTQDPDAVPLDVASRPLKDMGVKIYTVGVGHAIDLEELKQIATDPSDVFRADSFTDLLGKSQSFAAIACGDVTAKICVQGVDLGFIVDSSESIPDDDFVREKNAIKAISDEFIIAPESTRAGVVLYSSEPHVSIGFNQYSSNAEFNRAVNALPHMQSHTRLDKALRYAASHLYNKRRPGNPAIAIVMSDGKQTPGAESLTTAVQPLRDLGVRVFAVGVGSRVSQIELRELVEQLEDIYTVNSFSQLIEEAKKVTKRACPHPSETKRPPFPSPTQLSTSHRITPEMVPSLKPSDVPVQCNHFLDIVFVMDSSGSMDVREYKRQKDFVKKLAKLFNVGQGTRAAVIIYSDDPILSIDFEKYNTQKEFLDGIDALPYIMLRTRIDKALKMVSQVLLNTRPGFPKAVIIMTDGRQTRDPDYVPLKIAAKPLHNAGARVLVVGIGMKISVSELMLLVRDPSDVFTVKSFDSLVHAARDVAIKSCQGPFPSDFSETCSETIDLVFAMDSSGSMLISNYNKEKEFVKDVAGRFVVGSRQVMLGLIVFSNWPTVLVKLGSRASVSLASFDAAVDNAPYLRSRTRIDRAIQAAYTLFNRGRHGVPKVLVFLTDGRQSLDQDVTPLEEAVKQLIAQNVTIIVVGIGEDIDKGRLTILTNGQRRDITQIGSFDDLDKLKRSFSQTICRRVGEVIQSRSP